MILERWICAHKIDITKRNFSAYSIDFEALNIDFREMNHYLQIPVKVS